MILLIDNYDSFTYNIVYYLNKLDRNVLLFRNDEIFLKEIIKFNIKYICLSPGPGRPYKSNICFKLVKKYIGIIPILGICLGHQIICIYFNGKIIRSNIVSHGKISKIIHNEFSIFKNIKNIYSVIRYNSLTLNNNILKNNNIKIIAWDNNNNIMGLSNDKKKIYGIQFHPESFISKNGLKLFKNFINILSINE